jgi:hypothetical protein
VSWREGCAYRLVQRLEAKRDALVRESREKEAAARHPANAGNGTPGTGLVLAEVFSREEDLNADFRYGYPAGTTTVKRLAREAIAKAGPEVKYSDAWWAAEADRMVRLEEARRAALTPAQRKAEDDKRERDAQRAREKADRDNDAYWARRDMKAFRSGMAKGNEINLDQQIDREDRKKLS